MMKQFRRDNDGMCTNTRETQDEIRRDLDSCSRAGAIRAGARTTFTAIMATGSVVTAAIADRLVEMTRGHTRESRRRRTVRHAYCGSTIKRQHRKRAQQHDQNQAHALSYHFLIEVS
jgi:hypothetical protein